MVLDQLDNYWSKPHDLPDTVEHVSIYLTPFNFEIRLFSIYTVSYVKCGQVFPVNKALLAIRLIRDISE